MNRGEGTDKDRLYLLTGRMFRLYNPLIRSGIDSVDKFKDTMLNLTVIYVCIEGIKYTIFDRYITMLKKMNVEISGLSNFYRSYTFKPKDDRVEEILNRYNDIEFVSKLESEYEVLTSLILEPENIRYIPKRVISPDIVRYVRNHYPEYNRYVESLIPYYDTILVADNWLEDEYNLTYKVGYIQRKLNKVGTNK